MDKQEIIDQLLLLPHNELEELIMKVVSIRELSIGNSPGDPGWINGSYEATKYHVTITDLGPNYLKVKLYIMQKLYMSASDVNNIRLPFVLTDTFVKDFAEQWKEDLEQLGATVNVTEYKSIEIY